MAFHTGGTHKVIYAKETQGFGTAQTDGQAAPYTFRHTAASLNVVKDAFESEELRGDQQISDLRHGVVQANGDINFESLFIHYDDFLEGALGGTWQYSTTHEDPTDAASYTLVGQVLTANTNITDLTTLFDTDDYVYITGMTSPENNGYHKITAVASDSITVGTPVANLSDEATQTGVVINKVDGSTLIAGLGQPTFVIERQFIESASNATSYGIFRGCTINTWNMSVAPNAIATGAFGIIGKNGSYVKEASGDNIEAAGELNEPAGNVVTPTLSPQDSFSGTLTITSPEDGGGAKAVEIVTGIDFTLTRNLDPAFVIGANETVRIVPGRNTITGTMSIYMDDPTTSGISGVDIINDFINESDPVVVQFDLEDTEGTTSGNKLTVLFPRVKFSSGDVTVNNEAGIVISMNFQALYDETEQTNIKLTRTTYVP